MLVDGTWFKSSYSSNEHGSDCVEVAKAPDAVHVRDSKVQRGPSFAVPHAAWVDFISLAAKG
ncbi:hypothetical protein GCM10023347_10110 [Streptomyces chumphonensis]|uniref:DUF397 domain-containing protein n=1 Tax=Streptomyces chumphonensis TaxID=1214925 RepID=A0A927F2G6_9ACTN|nr:DUF397 domain-containing protein [Streptomyces chumphonensis]MBD3933983.1 DUF397 domain-containing protein [Streptomyces chumphonensis]